MCKGYAATQPILCNRLHASFTLTFVDPPRSVRPVHGRGTERRRPGAGSSTAAVATAARHRQRLPRPPQTSATPRPAALDIAPRHRSCSTTETVQGSIIACCVRHWNGHKLTPRMWPAENSSGSWCLNSSRPWPGATYLKRLLAVTTLSDSILRRERKPQGHLKPQRVPV